MTYLQRLTTQLAEHTARLPDAWRTRHGAYLAGLQNPDGGFSGRAGGSDLYYTGFALRGLSLLEALTPQIAAATADFLRGRLMQSASIVDFYSLLYSALLVQGSSGPDVLADSPPDWPRRTADVLETFRTADGGYGKAVDSASGSTYHTFLVGLCYELLGSRYPQPDAVLRFVASRRRDDGGYVEIAPMRRSGANPTAAAVGIVQMIQGENLDRAALTGVVDFLTGLVSMEGGLCANTRIPVADLLSTFTGSWTLAQLNALEQLDTAGILRYAQSLEQAGGGFRGGIWDEQADVEYTFYGLGTLALVWPLHTA